MSILEPALIQLAQGTSRIEQFYGYISITRALPLSLRSFLCNYEKTNENPSQASSSGAVILRAACHFGSLKKNQTDKQQMLLVTYPNLSTSTSE